MHRRGRKQKGKVRPVIKRVFDYYKEKAALFKNYWELKGTGISISDDFPANMLLKWGNLWESAKAERVQLMYVKIVNENALYSWNSAQSFRMKTSKQNTNAHDSQWHSRKQTRDFKLMNNNARSLKQNHWICAPSFSACVLPLQSKPGGVWTGSWQRSSIVMLFIRIVKLVVAA